MRAESLSHHRAKSRPGFRVRYPHLQGSFEWFVLLLYNFSASPEEPLPPRPRARIFPFSLFQGQTLPVKERRSFPSSAPGYLTAYCRAQDDASNRRPGTAFHPSASRQDSRPAHPERRCSRFHMPPFSLRRRGRQSCKLPLPVAHSAAAVPDLCAAPLPCGSAAKYHVRSGCASPIPRTFRPPRKALTASPATLRPFYRMPADFHPPAEAASLLLSPPFHSALSSRLLPAPSPTYPAPAARAPAPLCPWNALRPLFVLPVRAWLREDSAPSAGSAASLFYPKAPQTLRSGICPTPAAPYNTAEFHRHLRSFRRSSPCHEFPLP